MEALLLLLTFPKNGEDNCCRPEEDDVNGGVDGVEPKSNGLCCPFLLGCCRRSMISFDSVQ